MSAQLYKLTKSHWIVLKRMKFLVCKLYLKVIKNWATFKKVDKQKWGWYLQMISQKECARSFLQEEKCGFQEEVLSKQESEQIGQGRHGYVYVLSMKLYYWSCQKQSIGKHYSLSWDGLERNWLVLNLYFYGPGKKVSRYCTIGRHEIQYLWQTFKKQCIKSQ